jgi:copper(I)-binding protein
MMSDMKGMRTSTSMFRRAAAASLTIGALSFSLVACGDDDATSEGTKTSTQSTVGQLGIIGQWARASAEGATNGAVYFTIVPASDDTLTGASVPATVAARTEIHETMMMGGSDTTMPMGSETTMGMGSDTTMGGGGMQMSPVESIALTGGQDFVLEPGGFHVMLFDLVNPLKVGDTITVTLTFTNAGPIAIDVPVLDEAP